MKMYNNGQRKARKKAQAGGMMSTTPMQQNMSMKQEKPRMMMAGGGDTLKMVKNKAGKMVPDFAADGKGKMMYGGMAKGKKKTSA